MKKISEDKLNEIYEPVWLISNGKKEDELIAYAEKILTVGITIRDLIKLNKRITTEMGIDLIVRKSAAKVLEKAAREHGYWFTKKEYELYFDIVEDYEILRLKNKVIGKVRALNWVDNSILDEIKEINDLKLQGKYHEGDSIMQLVEELGKEIPENKKLIK